MIIILFYIAKSYYDKQKNFPFGEDIHKNMQEEQYFILKIYLCCKKSIRKFSS